MEVHLLLQYSPLPSLPLSLPLPLPLSQQEQRIGPPQFTIISLSATDADVVEQNLNHKSLNTYYEASMRAETGKRKKVYCYLYPKVGVTIMMQWVWLLVSDVLTTYHASVQCHFLSLL